ncbi:MAG: LCP family protein [Dehalococcoidia bacterium]
MNRSSRTPRRPADTRRQRGQSHRGGLLRGLVLISAIVLGFGVGLVLLQSIGSAAGELARGVGLPVPGGDDLPVWSGTERVNILLIGIDRRDDEPADLARSDTMIIATIDPKKRSIGLLSLPRDLLVTIPLSEKKSVEDRINTVFVYAKSAETPGGGPALAKKTVQQTLGVKVHYAAWIDFKGFVRVVDSLGGLMVDVRTPLKDDEFPTWDYGVQRIYFPTGVQRMDGERALMYARSRHQDSDVSRASRQQQILLAARQRALQLDLLPKLPRLIGEFSDLVKTDLSPVEILGLARIAKDVEAQNITLRTAPATPMLRGSADVLQLDRKALASVLADVFQTPGAQPEVASIEVLNGTSTTGLATRTAALLKEKGLSVTRFDTADETRLETAIFAANGKRQTAEIVAGLIGVSADRIREAPGAMGAPDIRVILGRDAKDPQR